MSLSLQLLGTLRNMGWQRTLREGAPCDARGEPQPWYTFGATTWIGARLRPTDRVFEYGAGNSSLWYAQRVAKVTSVEHDPSWSSRIARVAPGNVVVINETDPDRYVRTALVEGPYDIVVIDGEHRNRCAQVAVSVLKDSGLIVFDNSNWPEFAPGVQAVGERGYSRIDFEGINPGLGTLFTTSVFFKNPDRWLDPTVSVPDRSWETGTLEPDLARP